MKRDDYVCITWVDSMSHSGWRDIPKKPDMSCITVGIFIERTEAHTMVCLNRCSEDSYGHFMTIPNVAIKRIRKLR